VLFERQQRTLKGHVCQEYLDGLAALDIGSEGVPNFARMNERLRQLTGWEVVAVPGLIPSRPFFQMLANRQFPAGTFIRTREQLDYLEEPDIFHDVFGHVPLLAHPVFADYMQAYGQGGLRSLEYGAIDKLARLYWYTVEFGLIRSDAGLRLYGAGIVSSFAESRFALEDPSPNRLGFDLKRVMRTKYRIDDFQQNYFVIDSFDDLLRQTLETDFAPLYAELETVPDIDIATILPSDRIHTRGSQAYALGKDPA
jgi:phenylalanine-4-hydroxylase